MLLASQNEAGHTCPVSMTYAAVPALRKQPELAREWEPPIHTRRYDPRACPVAEKTGALMGMAMTEKQGGFGCACQHYSGRTHRKTARTF